MTPDAPQRDHGLREVFNAQRWIVRAGAPWRLLPHEFPPWHAVYDQTQRWLKAGSFAAIVHDLREVLRVAQGWNAQPSAVIFDARTLQSTPESGSRAGYDGHKRKKGSKTHVYERLPETLIGLHFIAFVCLMLQKAAPLLQVHSTLCFGMARVARCDTRSCDVSCADRAMRRCAHSVFHTTHVAATEEDGGLLSVPRRIIGSQ